MSIKLKTCVLGSVSVGKTCLLIRIHQGIFDSKTVSSIGIDFRSMKRKINNQQVTVQLWDSTGQQKYRSVVSNFFRDAQGVILTFDLTNQKTLADVQFWIGKINETISQSVPKVLVGNKADLKSQLSPQADKKVKQLCQQHNLKFYKVSAKTGLNVSKMYNDLLQLSYKYAVIYRRGKTQPLNPINPPKNKSGCC